jgi:hypothetical protein
MDVEEAIREIDLVWQGTRGRNESFRTIFYNLSGLAQGKIIDPITIPDF